MEVEHEYLPRNKMSILNGPFTIATVVYQPSEKVIENANNIFASVKQVLGNVQTIVVDNSPTCCRMAGKCISCDIYHWNDGYNIWWAGGINKAVELATGEVFIHFLATRGIIRNPLWVRKIINPLVSNRCGMAGPVRKCNYHTVTGDMTKLPKHHNHMQQAVFAARTKVLREVPWTGKHPHAYSDVEHSIKLIRAGYQLVDVAEVNSIAGGDKSDPKAWFEAGPNIG